MVPNSFVQSKNDLIPFLRGSSLERILASLTNTNTILFVHSIMTSTIQTQFQISIKDNKWPNYGKLKLNWFDYNRLLNR